MAYLTHKFLQSNSREGKEEAEDSYSLLIMGEAQIAVTSRSSWKLSNPKFQNTSRKQSFLLNTIVLVGSENTAWSSIEMGNSDEILS